MIVSQLQQQHDLSTREGQAEHLSDVAVLSCGSGLTNIINVLNMQFREAESAISDGKFCSERLLDGITNGNIRMCKISTICVMFGEAVQLFL